jgi:hypothetical protein
MWLCLTSADVEAVRAEGGVPYLPHEVRHLRKMKMHNLGDFNEKLKRVHLLKKIFYLTLEDFCAKESAEGCDTRRSRAC